MKQESTAILLRIFIGESDKYHHQELYDYLVKYLKEHHFAGVTVLRGIEGFGHKHMIHTANIVDLSTDLPILLEVVDTEGKITELKTMLDGLDLQRKVGMLITEETVKIVKYGKI